MPGVPEDIYSAFGFNGQSASVLPGLNLVVVRLGFTTDDSWSDEAFLEALLAAL